MRATRLMSILLACLPLAAAGQADSICRLTVEHLSPMPRTGSTVRSWMAGVGAVNLLDTYLSAEKHRGTELRFVAQTVRPTRYAHWLQALTHQGETFYAHNRADNGNTMGAQYSVQYVWRRAWSLSAERLRIEAGGGLEGLLGFAYNTRNTNNPAQARLALHLVPSVAASYGFRVKGRPLAVRYEASAPLAGVMFSPNYGQSYYEIFSRGNYDHNLVPTTLFSTPSLRQSLCLDFRAGHHLVRLGYLGDYQQARVNHLKFHQYAHTLLIGLTRQLTFKRQHP